jgi:hypothetical protein
VSTWLNDRDNQARVARAMAVLAGWMAEFGIPVSGTRTPAPR